MEETKANPDATKSAEGEEPQREYERFDFDVSQSFVPLAEGHENELPKWEEFGTVHCVDLSAGGVAFLWPGVPDFKKGLMALGKPPEVILMKLEVVTVCEKGDLTLVGCQFAGRITGQE